jgi:hemolysin III
LLRHFERAAFFVKIAATYTPIALVKLGGSTGPFLLGVVWSITALGAAVNLLLPDRLVALGDVLYLFRAGPSWPCGSISARSCRRRL